MLSDAELERLAGKAACDRGRVYYREGRVHLTAVAADALEGEAHGTETYRLWLPPSGFTDASFATGVSPSAPASRFARCGR